MGNLNKEYDRLKAKRYAEMYALTPNIENYPYFKDDDCVNFISQVIRAGGMSEQGNEWNNFNSWFCHSIDPKQLKNIAITWRASRYFKRHWGNENGMGRNRAYRVTTVHPNEFVQNFQAFYNILQIGDVIQYGSPIPYHTQVIHNKGFNMRMGRNDMFMAQHTENRLNVSLYRYLLDFFGRQNIYVYVYQIAG